MEHFVDRKRFELFSCKKTFETKNNFAEISFQMFDINFTLKATNEGSKKASMRFTEILNYIDCS